MFWVEFAKIQLVPWIRSEFSQRGGKRQYAKSHTPGTSCWDNPQLCRYLHIKARDGWENRGQLKKIPRQQIRNNKKNIRKYAKFPK